MTRALRPGVLFLFLILATAGRATADPILVTGGGVHTEWDGSGSFIQLFGSGLRVVTDVYNGGRFIVESGLQSLDGGVTFGTLGGSHTWSVSVNDTSYVAYLSGFVQFDAEPVLVPTGNIGEHMSVSTPFTMTGRLIGSTASLGGGTVLFDVLLAGIGTASTAGDAFQPNFFRVNGINYQFSDVAATPEPATLLLMGTGLAGLMARRRRPQTS